MKLIFKDTTELLNIMYGDEDDYGYISKKGLKDLLNDYIEFLEDIREDDNFADNGYIGDIINLIEMLQGAEFEEGEHRICSECGNRMQSGFCIESGLEYYCSEECLYKNISEEEYERLYDDGNGDTYYTEW